MTKIIVRVHLKVIGCKNNFDNLKMILLQHFWMDSIKYNAALAIGSAIKGSSREKGYQKLGLTLLPKRWWSIKLCYFFQNI